MANHRKKIAAAAVGLAAAMLVTGATAGLPQDKATATAELRSSKGESVGRAELVDTPTGVLITVTLTAAPPGPHGFHVHETGRCDAPTFESAGGHFNPTQRKHGFRGEGGAHAGDLPNLHVPESGRLTVELLAPGLTLRAGAATLFDADGSALVLHQAADDYASDPAGESGTRVACGVIRR